MREDLRAAPLFAGLTEEDLDRLAAGAYEETAVAGEVVFREGEQGDAAHLIVEGSVEVLKASGNRDVPLAVRITGDLIGEMALLDVTPRMATVRAREDTRFLTIPKQHMDELLATSPTAARSVFGVLLSRWRETESRLRQSEKMAQIGALSAGLAHEINNPAAAVMRGASRLGPAMERLAAATAAVGAAGLPADSPVERLIALAAEAEPVVGSLEVSDRESEVEELLGSVGVERPWKPAQDLAAIDIPLPDLALLMEEMDPASAVLAAEAAGATADVRSLVREIEQGAERLSAIVGALKSYSHLDRAPVQEIDVHKGLDDTLLILRRKLDGVEVVRDYAEGPLLIEGHAGELNQVWTNLIDNAADALAAVDDACIVLRSRRAADGGVVVEVEDNGPGIPPEVVGRVFDAFFTTKPPGVGTGLGLDISYGIVVGRHGGELTVESEPGRTTFCVVLPPSLPH